MAEESALLTEDVLKVEEHDKSPRKDLQGVVAEKPNQPPTMDLQSEALVKTEELDQTLIKADLQAEVSMKAEESVSPPIKNLQAEKPVVVQKCDPSTNERSFGHCIVTWEIKNYGRALWQKDFKVETPEFSVKGHNTQNTKWKLILETESGPKSLVEKLKVNVNYKEKEKGSLVIPPPPPKASKLNYTERMNEHEKEMFESICFLVDNMKLDSKLSVKNLMLHLERSKSDDGPTRVWVDWKVSYIGINGERHSLADMEHIFTKSNGYVSNIGTLYDYERDFDYNSGVMTFFCEMIIKNVDVSLNIHDDMSIDLYALSEDLRWTFDQRKFCDAEINVDDKRVKVHKAILCSHSNFFESLFNPADGEKRDVIKLPDMKYNEIMKILEYMYSYDIENVVGKPSLSLFNAAVQINLKDLVEHYSPEEYKIRTTVDIKKLTFLWTIENFSKKFDPIASPIACNDIEEAWQIILYPKGIKDVTEEIAIIVECIEGTVPDGVCVQCAVMSEDEKLVFSKTLICSEVDRTKFEDMKFIERKDICKLLSKDVLRIGLKVRTCIGKDSTINHKSCTPNLYTKEKAFENMAKNMLSLKQNNKYADVVLKIGNEEIKAHKFILSARSHLLAKELEETNVLSFPEVSPTTFKILLDYVYCASLNVRDVNTVIDVYKVAEEFIISHLKEKCSHFLKEKLAVDNVCSILRLAAEYYDEYLKATALEFVKVNENKLKSYMLQTLHNRTHFMWCGKEIPKKSENLPVKSLVKNVYVKEYTENSILLYELEIESETLNVRSSRKEETSLIFLESNAKEITPPYKVIPENLEDSSTNEETSTEIRTPDSCDTNVQSTIQMNKSDIPLKKRDLKETDISKSSEGREAAEQLLQNGELRNSLEQSKDDVIMIPQSPPANKSTDKTEQSQSACEISKTEAKNEKNRTNEMSPRHV